MLADSHDDGRVLTGPLAPILRAVDWAKTPLGPVAAWPRTLKGYVAMIEELPTPAIVFWGPEQTQIYNAGYAVILGPRHPRYLGAAYRDCWPDTYPTIYPWMRKVLDHGETLRVENELIPLTRHGFDEDAYFTFSFSPLRDDHGQIAGILQPVLEVTANVLRDRRAKMLRTMAPAADGCATTAAFDAIRAHPKDVAFARLFSAGPMGLHAQCGEGGDEALLRACAGRVQASGVAEKVQTGPGRFAWALPMTRANTEAPRGTLILGINPALPFDLAYQEFFENVASSLAAEALAEELRRSNQNFRTLAETIPQQVWTSGPDGGLDFVNARVTDYFATPSAQILGAGWLGVLHPDDVASCVERWTHSLKTGSDYEVEFRLRAAGGQYRWHLGRAQALRGEHGAIVRWFGTNTDIHEAKMIREDLKRRTEFEQHLVGIVSHDLRNPLNAILISASNLGRNEALDGRAAKSVLRIQSSAERATRMIRDLLDFTQARLGGSIPFERSHVGLTGVIRVVLDELETAHPGRQISVTYDGELSGDWDGDRIAQVVQNLTTNALNYSPETTPVTLAVRGDGTWVDVRVHNEGLPIPADKLAAIFEPLQRATADVDRTGRSIGLGLYIVKQIVDGHGGTIAVQSTEQEGTTFAVRLPVRSG